MNKNTKVKCKVESCNHNNHNLCNLDVLDISCNCDGSTCHNKNETICHSFSLKNK